MSPGKSPKKRSRQGCKRCRSRKVKCNEARPICNNCRRHSVPCQYDEFVNYGSAPQYSVADSDPNCPRPAASSLATSRGGPILEMRLLHHFISAVAPTFPSSNSRSSREMWTVHAVRMAFQHNFLLHAIYACAALHLVRKIPDSDRFNAETASSDDFSHLTRAGESFSGVDLGGIYHFYLDQAIKQQREAVDNLNPYNANALLLSSILVSYQGLKLLPSASASIFPSPSTTTTATPAYDLPSQWLHMTRGITDISTFAYQYAWPERITDIMARIGGEPDFRNLDAIFDPAHRAPFAALLTFDERSEPDLDLGGPALREAYEMALSYVGRLHRAVETREDARTIFRLVLCFAVMVPARFLGLVDERRPRALAILAHYFACAKAVDDHWVFAGLADREVCGIKGLLPESWQWTLEWPFGLLNGLRQRAPT